MNVRPQNAYLLLMTLLTILPGHNQASAADAVVDPQIYAYATHDSISLSAYVFQPPRPDSATRRPVILVFHGGGWAFGEAAWSFSRAKRFAQLGMVAVAVQYRLSDQKAITPLEAMSDARNIIRWVRENADTLGADPNRIAAFGWSAGAHLAACAALFGDSGQSIAATAPNALILISPALDVSGDLWVKTLLGARATPEQISPAHHVRDGMPHTLIQIGETDSVTPLAGARLFCERMASKGNDCELQVYPGVGHLFTPSHLDDTGWPQPDSTVSALASARIDSFLIRIGYVE